MTLIKIVTDYLLSNGFSGLCNDECGCRLDDLMPCEQPNKDCVPGYVRLPTTGDPDDEWEVTPNQPPTITCARSFDADKTGVG